MTQMTLITKEVFQLYLDHKANAEAYEKAFDAVAAEIVLYAFGERASSFIYTTTSIHVDSRYDHANAFKTEWLWDPEWKLRVDEFKAEMRRRCDAMAERSKKEDAARLEKSERETLARLKIKYPEA